MNSDKIEKDNSLEEELMGCENVTDSF